MKNIIVSLAFILGLSLSFVSYGCTYKDVDVDKEYEDVDDDDIDDDEIEEEVEEEIEEGIEED